MKKYTGGWDGTNETKDYFERLTLELRKTCPNLKKPVLMVPVGHVMYELNQRMKAGAVPGYKQIKDVFADGIHLNNVGSYVVGCTYFATLCRENPEGLAGGTVQGDGPEVGRSSPGHRVEGGQHDGIGGSGEMQPEVTDPGRTSIEAVIQDHRTDQQSKKRLFGSVPVQIATKAVRPFSRTAGLT